MTARRVKRWLPAIALVGAVLAACTGSAAIDGPRAQVSKMVASTQVLDALGPSFSSSALPVTLTGETNVIFGSVILNGQVEPTGDDLRSMHWVVHAGRADFVLARSFSRQGDGTVRWEPTSAWTVALGADTVVTVGTSVCKPAPDTYDWLHGEFVAIVNRSQDHAFAAWVMAESGPTPYRELATLDCERFVP